MKVYLIGPVSLIFDHSHPTSGNDLVKQFNAAENELTAQGFEVVNPISFPLLDERGLLTKRIKEMLKCDKVMAIPDWNRDPVAQIEMITADKAGLEIILANDAIKPFRITFFTH